MANRLIKYIQSTNSTTGLNVGKLVVGDSFPTTTSTAMFAVANDWSGNLFVADIESNCIYLITESGKISLFAGSPNQDGYVNGTGTDARFQNPKGIACDRSGNVYVADTGNNRIRKIDMNGRVTTIAGGFNAPGDIAVAPNGDIIVADTGNHAIYRVRAGGQTLLVAGSSGNAGNVAGDTGGVKIKGSAARFNSPSSVTVDNTGNIYVADTGNYQVKIIHPDGWVKIFAGSVAGNVNGVAASARFTSLLRVKANRSGCLYVIDAVATYNRVKKIDANGNVSTYGSLLKDELAFGIAVSPADKVFVVVATSSTPAYESSSSSSSQSGSSVSSASSEKSSVSSVSSVSSASSEISSVSSVSSASSNTPSSQSSVSSVSSASSEISSVSSVSSASSLSSKSQSSQSESSSVSPGVRE